MTTKHLALALTVTLAGACKKKEDTKSGDPAGQQPETAQQQPRPSQGTMPQLPALELPDDPKRAEKVALGHALFFDTRLSGNNDRSCYSCHQNEHGNGGKDPLAIGSGDKVLTRHSPVIWNVAYYNNSLYWDGRAANLEAQTKGAWGGGNMGAGADNLDKKAAEVAKIDGYKKLFADAFGDTEIKADHVAQAISEYMRTLVCNDTAYDKFAAGDKSAMNEQQQRGLDLFFTKAACITCHAPPYFSNAMGIDGGIYHNVGIGTQGVDEDKVDLGRMAVTKNEADWGKFKPPSLRNVTRSAPYFHDGSVAKLEDAVKIMASGGIKNKNIDPLLVDRKLTDDEVADIVAFLGALDCPGKLEEPTLP